MARKLVIILVALAIALLTYAPMGVPMDSGGMAAMADCTISMDDGAAGADDGAGTDCAIDGICLAVCVFSNGIPSFHVSAASIAFAPSAAPSAMWTNQDPMAAASGLPPFRPPRRSPQA